MSGEGRRATRVAAGILVTRLLGFVRERAMAHYVGNAVAADAFRAALRIPNLIRNLLGEGTLSASFIPIYAGLEERNDPAAARALAGAVAGLLLLATGVLAVAGIALAPAITRVVAPGFGPEARALTTMLVRILFPMTGLLALAGWALGVLTTHRRFFLPYVAPALWNVASIAALVIAAVWLVTPADLATALAWGAVAGSILQLAVQLPACARLLGGLRPTLRLRTAGVADVLRAWTPVVIGAGVMQISGLIDTQLGSLTGPGAVATLGYAQLLQLLPVSLFGVSVAAVALPELSRDVAAGSDPEVLRARVGAGLARIGFFLVPMAVLYAEFGQLLAGALFQTGRFTTDDTALVGAVLAAYAVAIWPQASVRLLASGFYARKETGAPVKIAAVSIVVSTVSAIVLMQPLGVAGIAAGSAIGALVNVSLLTLGLERRLGRVLDRQTAWSFGKAGLGAGAGWMAGRFVLPSTATLHPAVALAVVLIIFGVVYVGVTWALGHSEAKRFLRR
jgi:putative peptidoglycan lipid II flippase